MSRQNLVDKTEDPKKLGALQFLGQQLANLTPAQLAGARPGTVPIGVYKGVAAFWDLDLAVVQPLIWAEKQWVLDRVDTREGSVKVNVPIGTAVGESKTDVIEVPAGELWYLCEHEIAIPQVSGLTAGAIGVNFRVSSFPKVDTADKLYYDTADPQVSLVTKGAKVSGGGLTATQAEIAAGAVYDHKLIITHGWIYTTAETAKDWVQELKRDFRQGDELNTELRLLGGAKLTLVVTVATAAVAGAAVDVYLRVWGRKAKLLVS